MEGKHHILKQINDADQRHKQLKQEVFDLLDQIKSLEESVNSKLTEIDSIEQEYVELISKLMGE